MSIEQQQFLALGDMTVPQLLGISKEMIQMFPFRITISVNSEVNGQLASYDLGHVLQELSAKLDHPWSPDDIARYNDADEFDATPDDDDGDDDEQE